MNSSTSTTSVNIEAWDWTITGALRDPNTGKLNIRPAMIATGARIMESTTAQINQQLDAMALDTVQLNRLNSVAGSTLNTFSAQDYYTARDNGLLLKDMNQPNALAGAYIGPGGKAIAFTTPPAPPEASQSTGLLTIKFHNRPAPTGNQMLDDNGNLITNAPSYEGRVLQFIDDTTGDVVSGYFHDDGNGSNFWPLANGYRFKSGPHTDDRVPDPAETISVPVGSYAVPVNGKLLDNTGQMLNNPAYEGKVLRMPGAGAGGTTLYFYYHFDAQGGQNVTPVDLVRTSPVRVPNTQAEMDSIQAAASDEAQSQSRTTQAKQTFVKSLMVELKAISDFTSNGIERKERDADKITRNF